MNVNFSKGVSGIDLLKRIMKITLNNKIAILKILTPITFLFVTIPEDGIPMWFGILAGLDSKGLPKILYIIIACAVIFIFISSTGFSRMNQWLTITAVGILYFPILFTIVFAVKYSFKYKQFFPLLTYDVFIVISLLTIALMIQKMKMDKSTQQKRNGFLDVTK